MRISAVVICSVPLLVLSCTQELDVLVPNNPGYSVPPGTQPLSPPARLAMEGIYRVNGGEDVFGEFVALKWSYVADGPDTTFFLSIFGGREVTYFILEGGRLDSVCRFGGYWRKLRSTETGNAAFSITPGTGARRLLGPVPNVVKDSLVLIGRFQSGSDGVEGPISLRYQRPVFRARPFAIIAHRGGGRNSDLLPVSENTVEMVLMAERLGATGVEIDVQITLDGVPILYHDVKLNLRLNQKNGLVGPVESYTYAQLQTFVRLIHGERIPTLLEVLEAIIERTNLRIVWLDMKSAKPSMALVRAVQRIAMAKANLQALGGRRNPLVIVIGLPTEEKVEEFLTLSDYQDAPALCELSIEQVRRTGAAVWAPRWTLGTQPAEVAQMHAEGRKVVVWTLDVPLYVTQFTRTGDLDGILSNYPSLVAFAYYVLLPE